ncbi:hypothetical protein CSOJ01_15607 [Colletotrichum sojae]|uniref:Uncharacterized protein n=1 Tax=Colletotrichum sojae TaxID=2175907 RepID=A0A8H6IM10_9PEZI|nr:hypothetical protein CSOJ01_15607 [Colletotrichum sojae]
MVGDAGAESNVAVWLRHFEDHLLLDEGVSCRPIDFVGVAHLTRRRTYIAQVWRELGGGGNRRPDDGPRYVRLGNPAAKGPQAVFVRRRKSADSTILGGPSQLPDTDNIQAVQEVTAGAAAAAPSSKKRTKPSDKRQRETPNRGGSDFAPRGRPAKQPRTENVKANNDRNPPPERTTGPEVDYTWGRRGHPVNKHIFNSALSRFFQYSHVLLYTLPDSEPAFCILLCPEPECPSPQFSAHPLKNGRAAKHIEKRGVWFNSETTMASRYARKACGLARGLRMRPCRSPSAKLKRQRPQEPPGNMEAGRSTTQGGAPYRPSSRRLRGGGLIERYVVTVVLVFGNNDPVWARRYESITKKHHAAATQHRPGDRPRHRTAAC